MSWVVELGAFMLCSAVNGYEYDFTDCAGRAHFHRKLMSGSRVARAAYLVMKWS